MAQAEDGLQDKGGLPDTWLPAEEDEGAFDEPTTEDAVQLRGRRDLGGSRCAAQCLAGRTGLLGVMLCAVKAGGWPYPACR